MTAPTILLVEDDPVLRTFLADNLTADGYEPVVAETLRDGVRVLEFQPARPRDRRPRAARRLGARADRARAGGGRGRVAARSRRCRCSSCPARAGELDRVRGFERGADDFVAKPFSYAELRAADRGACCAGRRRRSGSGGCGSASSRSTPRRARCGCAGGGSSCRRRSSRCCARSRPSRRACSRRRSCCATSGASASLGATRTLDSHACRLRQKLGVDGDRFVVNVWGVGYRLVDGPVLDVSVAA